MRKTLAVLVIVLTLSACDYVSQAQFEQHTEFHELQASYEVLRGQLTDWANGMVQWGENTRDAVCDIVIKNPASYATSTVQYCGGGDGGPGDPPDPPPVWGEE